MTKDETREKRPRINLRYLVLCALGLVFGIFLIFRIRFGGLRPSDFCFLLVFLVYALVPLSWKRTGIVLVCVLIFGAIGAGAAHLYTQRFLRVEEEGRYRVAGMVCSFTVENGYTRVLLEDITLDAKPVGGKMQVSVLSEAVRMGDILTFEANVKRNGLPMSGDSYAEYLFYTDIRYRVASVGCEIAGKSSNIFYRIQSALYDVLEENLDDAEAEVAFALLTGNTHGMDEGLLEDVRSGGIAHIFAVSGLHIGILYGAVMLLCGKLGRKAFFPAVAVAVLYTAFCAFTVSSVRAVIMCAVLGGYRAIGRKYDFLQSISLAAIVVLLFGPADFLSAGFRLSFGACLGLALFAGSFSRLFTRIPHFPRLLRNYFAANLSVQIFTFPILLETFGYFSAWGFLLNLVFIPLLPVFFLTTLIFSLFSLIIPSAAFVFLMPPKALLSILLLVFSAGNFSRVLTGFSLGMGGVIWLLASLFLSERFRLARLPRLGMGALLGVAFTLAVLLENVVFTGVRINVYTKDNGAAALIRTRTAAVLVIDGDIRIKHCEDFLAHTYGGTLDAVFVLSEDEADGINHAAFLDADVIYARDFVPTGLRETPVLFREEVTVDGLAFHFESREKLSVRGEGTVVEIDFENCAALGADLFIDSSSGGLKFFLKNGIMRLL